MWLNLQWLWISSSHGFVTTEAKYTAEGPAVLCHQYASAILTGVLLINDTACTFLFLCYLSLENVFELGSAEELASNPRDGEPCIHN